MTQWNSVMNHSLQRCNENKSSAISVSGHVMWIWCVECDTFDDTRPHLFGGKKHRSVLFMKTIIGFNSWNQSYLIPFYSDFFWAFPESSQNRYWTGMISFSTDSILNVLTVHTAEWQPYIYIHRYINAFLWDTPTIHGESSIETSLQLQPYICNAVTICRNH